MCAANVLVTIRTRKCSRKEEFHLLELSLSERLLNDIDMVDFWIDGVIRVLGLCVARPQGQREASARGACCGVVGGERDGGGGRGLQHLVGRWRQKRAFFFVILFLLVLVLW